MLGFPYYLNKIYDSLRVLLIFAFLFIFGGSRLRYENSPCDQKNIRQPRVTRLGLVVRNLII